MDCFFCHNEGMDNPRRPTAPLGAADPPANGGGGQQPAAAVSDAAAKKRDPLKRKGPSVLSTEHLLGIMNAFTRLGGKQINVTGDTRHGTTRHDTRHDTTHATHATHTAHTTHDTRDTHCTRHTLMQHTHERHDTTHA